MVNFEAMLTDRRRNAVYLFPSSFRLVLNPHFLKCWEDEEGK